MQLFEKDDRDMFRKGKTFVIENQPYKILSMCVSPNEDQLMCSLENNQVENLNGWANQYQLI